MLFIKKILFNIIIAFVYAVLSRLIINYSVSNYFESDDIFILKILSYIPIMIFTIFQIWKNKEIFNFEFLFKNNLVSAMLIFIIVYFSLYNKISLINDKSFNISYLLFISFFIQCIITGIFEEIFCRVLIYGYVSKHFEKTKYSMLKSILFTSTIFSLMHLTGLFNKDLDLISVINQVLFAFIMGIFLNSVFIISKNLLLVIIMHGMFNFNGMFKSKVLQRNITINDVNQSNMDDFIQSFFTFALFGILIALPILIVALKNKKFFLIKNNDTI